MGFKKSDRNFHIHLEYTSYYIMGANMPSLVIISYFALIVKVF